MSRGSGRAVRWLAATVIGCVAWAAPGAEFAGGTGEPGNPYQIASVEQLLAIGADPNLMTKHFVLIRDLDLAGVDPNRVRPIDVFRGVFEGRDHTITNLRIVRPNASLVGLFGQVGMVIGHEESPPAHVRDLHLTNVNIQGQDAVGGLAGALGAGTITNCSVTGVVVGHTDVGGLVGWAPNGQVAFCVVQVDVKGDVLVGGLIGAMDGVATRCSSSGRVTGRESVGGLMGLDGGMLTGLYSTENRPEPNEFRRTTYCRSDCSVAGVEKVGGLLGVAWRVGGIEDCYALGPVNGTTSVGGLVGDADGSGIVRCFSGGRVTGKEKTGGLIGSGEFSEEALKLTQYPPCHLIVKELPDHEVRDRLRYLIVYRPGFVSCFWDAQASGVRCGLGSGLDAQGGIKPLATAEARTARMFQDFGWDLERVWTMQEGESYPRLRWEESRSRD